jgi:steroid delta-isomerase-like uncharacterized protein
MEKLVKAVYVSAAIAVLVLCLLTGCQQQDMNAMAEARAQAMVEKVEQFWNEGNLDLADEIYATNVVRHDLALKQDFEGIEAQKKLVEDNRTAFPDLKITVTELIVKGDTLAMKWTDTGTNTGPMGDTPPTGKPVQFMGMSLVHLIDGKAVEIWDFYNQLDILQQLGYMVAPPPGMMDRQKLGTSQQ